MPAVLDRVRELIDYEETGTGPTIVLVPGSCSTGAAWRPVIAGLKDRFRCVTTSLLGYGGTGERRSADDASISHEVEAMEWVICKAGARVHLVGHSFGPASQEIQLEVSMTRALTRNPEVNLQLELASELAGLRGRRAAPHQLEALDQRPGDALARLLAGLREEAPGQVGGDAAHDAQTASGIFDESPGPEILLDPAAHNGLGRRPDV